MVNSNKQLGLLDNICWPEESEVPAYEQYHWLGKVVEQFFDFGQKTHAVIGMDDKDILTVAYREENRSLMGTALKVIECAFKVIFSIATGGLLPLAMLFGRCVHRAHNSFAEIEDTDLAKARKFAEGDYCRDSCLSKLFFSLMCFPDFALEASPLNEESKRMANQICERYKAEGGVHYARLERAIDDLALNSLETPVSLDRIADLHTEIHGVMKEIEQLKQRREIAENQEILEALEVTEAGLSELLAAMADSMAAEERKEQICKAFTVSCEQAIAEIELDQSDKEAWRAIQSEVVGRFPGNLSTSDLNNEKNRKVIDQQLVCWRNEAHRTMGDLPSYSSIERFLRHDALLRDLGLEDQRAAPFKESEDPYTSLKKLVEISKGLINPKGIRNLSNSCYLNALLQAIMAEPSFIEHLNRVKPGDKESVILIRSLKLFVRAYRSGETIAMMLAADSVRNFLYTKGYIGGNGRRNDQEDAAEVLQFILGHINYPGIDATIDCSYELDGVKGVKSRKDPINTLKLPMKSEGNAINSGHLQGLADCYFDAKKMHEAKQEDGLVIDDDETRVCDYDEQISLDTAPDILMIDLKRFERRANGTTAKITEQIAIPQSGLIDLSSAFKGNAPSDGGSAIYRVKGVIQHHGRFGGGHYTSSVNRGGSWVKCDDTEISEKDKNPGADGYVYFLERVYTAAPLVS